MHCSGLLPTPIRRAGDSDRWPAGFGSFVVGGFGSVSPDWCDLYFLDQSVVGAVGSVGSVTPWKHSFQKGISVLIASFADPFSNGAVLRQVKEAGEFAGASVRGYFVKATS